LFDINIPSGIAKIEQQAFAECRNLTSVTIQHGVKSIGYYSFSFCENLQNITIPSSVTSIDPTAFICSSNITVNCVNNSAAHKYCVKNHIEYQLSFPADDEVGNQPGWTIDWASVSAALFVFNCALLLLHEMDAIRAKEWKMFAVLKSMREETAYIVFASIHFPLYLLLTFIMAQAINSSLAPAYYIVMNLLLIAHTGTHFFFRRHSANGFTSFYSNALIYAMGIFALLHLVLCSIVNF
jgi:hypothetical protein